MSLIIRRAAADEAEPLSALARASKGHWRYPHAWMEAWRDDLTLTPAYVSAHRVYVATEGNARVGFYALEDGGDHWSVAHLWVEPPHLGRGIGRFLLGDLLRRAALARPGPVRVRSDPNAEPFYLRMGFRRVGEDDAPVEGTPRVLPVLERAAAPVAAPPVTERSTGSPPGR